MKENFYKYQSLTPNFRKERKAKKINAPLIKKEGNNLHFTVSSDIHKVAVYELEVESLSRDRASGLSRTVWRANLIKIQNPKEKFTGKKGRHYTVIAINGKDYSPLSEVVYVE